MTTTSRREFHDELTTWLEQVKAEQGGTVNLRYIVISDDADQHTIDAAIIALTGKKTRACIPSTKDEIQADIDELLGRRSALTATP